MWQVVGQERVVGFLERSLSGGRLAHAYLFLGPPHVGKGSLALNFAQALNCTGVDSPCGTCPSCQRIARRLHPDVLWIVRLPDEKTGRLKTEIGIDQIREVESLASLPPYQGRFRVFIIDGAESLSSEAANAILKTLEEPPSRVCFILLSAQEGALLPTLVSRCQRVELRRLPVPEVARFLEERGLSPDQAGLRAVWSQGCPGRALDQGFLSRREEALGLLERLLGMGLRERFALADGLASHYEQERDPELLSLWLGWWRDVLLLQVGCPEVRNPDRRERLEAVAQQSSLTQVRAALKSLKGTIEGLRRNASPFLSFQVLMLDMPRIGSNRHG